MSGCAVTCVMCVCLFRLGCMFDVWSVTPSVECVLHAVCDVCACDAYVCILSDVICVVCVMCDLLCVVCMSFLINVCVTGVCFFG